MRDAAGATPARSTRTGRARAASSSAVGGTVCRRAGAWGSRLREAMTQTVNIFVSLEERDAPLPELAARALARRVADLGPVRLVRRSLDARRGRPLGYNLRLEIGASAPAPRAVDVRWPAG